MRRGGKGILIQHERTGALSTLNNQSVLQDRVYCLQGNGIDRADTAGCNGKGWRENESYTLNTIDRPAVCYGVDCYNQSASEEISKSLNSVATDSDHVPCVAYSQDAYDKYTETDKSATIKQSGGVYGGAAKLL